MKKQIDIPIHNRQLSYLIKDYYSLKDVREIFSLLEKNNTFYFPILTNGLFPAANLQEATQYTGYGNVWVRDNIYVDLAHQINGHTEVTLRNIKTLAEYFIKHKWRFEKIIAGALDHNNPMNRPHIRFNGEDLSEINPKWAHAENDALGYFLWLFCRIHNRMDIGITDKEKELLTLFALYLEAIRYWEDEDSGHWEESRKIEASSIGIAVGGLAEFKNMLQKEDAQTFSYHGKTISNAFLDFLITKGKDSLQQILPSESIQSDRGKNRRFDAALLFLIFPIDVVSQKMADQILYDVMHNLQGNYGIHRYLGDSFWSADYKDKLKPEERTIDFSDNIARRDSLLKKGQEAQWCIFDPIISVIYGLKYQTSRQEEHLKLQIRYFNRSLGQLTGENCPFGTFKCPELFYLEKGQYVPNDTVPLLWTQANLWMAFKVMNDSLKF
ncbi:phosphorylase kinase [Candidatus Campbellbacteria bacterium RIFCSPHIGHO2_12_FULL_35_10]|uniref:Phosphorylase kinase n=1 Tax=Candidatus Campbellbacteria bacterium RIFCSPHIGHO2_12_FULL_35_10 TaxID=1797578 RepID=A0A1F5EQK7_9BACT|nr:MAG: phosphorylase kinase [Candidatus Campbellbacteria bacterium RIFCSPHIGHO2_12_FULL_35_10]